MPADLRPPANSSATHKSVASLLLAPLPGPGQHACQYDTASSNLKVCHADMMCLQVWQIMPKDKLEFLQAELSFFDEVTQVSLQCCPLSNQAAVLPVSTWFMPGLLPSAAGCCLGMPANAAAPRHHLSIQMDVCPYKLQALPDMGPRQLVHAALLPFPSIVLTALQRSALITMAAATVSYTLATAFLN